LREVIEGKRLIVVDDTIVRGNTQRAIISMLREAGATEVHVRISAPPVQWPCFYGIDFPTREELAAVGHSLEELCEQIGADSLAHISIDGMVAATQQAAERLCTACFSGTYPIEPPVDARHLLARAVVPSGVIHAAEHAPADPAPADPAPAEASA
jgi:amidophosphoribosyltransferase